MLITGLMMCLSCLTYGVVIQNDPPLRIYFPNEALRPVFTYAFYLCLFTGLLTILGAGIVILMDIFYPRKIAAFFHHAHIEEDDVFQVQCTPCVQHHITTHHITSRHVT